MKTLKTLAAAAVAIAALAGAAEAGAKKHGFHYNPIWEGPSHHGGSCWYEYHTVPQAFYAKVKHFKHGRPYWKRIKQVRYIERPQKVCDWYRY